MKQATGGATRPPTPGSPELLAAIVVLTIVNAPPKTKIPPPPELELELVWLPENWQPENRAGSSALFDTAPPVFPAELPVKPLSSKSI